MYGGTIFTSEFRTGIQKIGGTEFTMTPACLRNSRNERERFCVRRERDRTRRAARSKEEREAALLRMRAYGRSRVASETADERQARLQRLATYETVGWRD